MNRELRDRWCAALRSGEYAQCRGSLRHPFGSAYCCLGVLCEVSDLPGKRWDGSYLRTDGSEIFGGYAPKVLLPQKYSERLATLNDDAGYTFAQIADWIEANVPVE